MKLVKCNQILGNVADENWIAKFICWGWLSVPVINSRVESTLNLSAWGLDEHQMYFTIFNTIIVNLHGITREYTLVVKHYTTSFTGMLTVNGCIVDVYICAITHWSLWWLLSHTPFEFFPFWFVKFVKYLEIFVFLFNKYRCELCTTLFNVSALNSTCITFQETILKRRNSIMLREIFFLLRWLSTLCSS